MGAVGPNSFLPQFLILQSEKVKRDVECSCVYLIWMSVFCIFSFEKVKRTLFVFMFLCLWYFCFQKKSKELSVSLPYLSWNIETSAVVNILFLIVFMQLKLKIEQLVCHWRVKMLQAQSVFTGERLTLLNFPPPLPFQTSWATQYFEYWDLNIEYLDCQLLQA